MSWPYRAPPFSFQNPPRSHRYSPPPECAPTDIPWPSSHPAPPPSSPSTTSQTPPPPHLSAPPAASPAPCLVSWPHQHRASKASQQVQAISYRNIILLDRRIHDRQIQVHIRHHL